MVAVAVIIISIIMIMIMIHHPLLLFLFYFINVERRGPTISKPSPMDTTKERQTYAALAVWWDLMHVNHACSTDSVGATLIIT
jgi:hypothetical protein